MSVRTAAAIAVVAGVVTTLLPLSATAASAAPAADGADGAAVLRTEMSTPVPNGPLTRGGATEAFELTVENLSDKAVEYKPWLPVEQTGPSPLKADDLLFKVDAVDAPATKFSVGQQDGGWQGLFYPATSGRAGHGFDIPAKGKMTWKVTIGLGANYPANDGDFKLTAAPSNGQEPRSGASHVFKVAPQIKAGELKTWFNQVDSGMDGQDQRAYLNLNYQATGDGTFDSALATALTLSHPGTEKADFRLQALIDGRWQDVEGDHDRYRLPQVPKGFGAAAGVRTVQLRVSLGKDTELTKKTAIRMDAETGLAQGNTYPFKGSSVTFPLKPIAEPAPSSTPSTTPSKAPASTPEVRPAAATSSAAVAPAGNTNLTTTTGSATGSLASTGSSSATGLYAGLAGALVALGAAAAWLGARRRRGISA
ncbi:hypothetical protein ACFWBN_00090 [Streptomyces sp. NPDC059989]|uniref:hypothetical protein n=1 Tax=Streptomyces sp. NPDC059989 TaxID=3347026 RepID=UPI0036BA8051